MSSPRRNLGDLARLLADKARNDEIAVQKLIDDFEVPDEVIRFHAQQAMEALQRELEASRPVG